jgi:hypothetical protein
MATLESESPTPGNANQWQQPRTQYVPIGGKPGAPGAAGAKAHAVSYMTSRQLFGCFVRSSLSCWQFWFLRR